MLALRGLVRVPRDAAEFRRGAANVRGGAELRHERGPGTSSWPRRRRYRKDVPFVDDIYRVGTVCRVRQMLRQPGGKTVRVMVEGVARGRIADRHRRIQPSLVRGDRAHARRGGEADASRRRRSAAAARRSSASTREISGNVSVRRAVINIMASTDAAYVADFISAEHLSQARRKSRSCWRSSAPRAGSPRSAVC